MVFFSVVKFYVFLYFLGLILYYLYSKTKVEEFEFGENFLKDGCVPPEILKETNKHINPHLLELVKTKFFRYFKVNLESECPFWAQESICNSAGCSVCYCEDDEVPSVFREETTSKISDPVKYDKNFDPHIMKDDSEWDNYWNWRVEEYDIDSGVYVDIVDNIEAYTGYQGQQIWTIIETENCFTGKEEELCLEERTLNRVLGGLHTSVSSHLSEYYIDFEKDRNKMFANTTIYFDKVGNHPERIKNLYYYYSVLLRAINMSSDFLKNYNYTTGNPEIDVKTEKLMNTILDTTIGECNTPFNEQDFFTSFQSQIVKVQYQNYIHNISRLMDCVECEKCKTFGKMQVYGIGTALKILFSGGSQVPALSRNEVVVLINTFTKVSTSLQILDRMYYRRYHRQFIMELSIFVIASYILLFLGIIWIYMKFFKKRSTTKHKNCNPSSEHQSNDIQKQTDSSTKTKTQ